MCCIYTQKSRKGGQMSKRLLAAAGMLAICGCYYGTMQGARTLGDGQVTIGGNLQMPAFFSSQDRQEAEDSGEDYFETYGSLAFSIGATDDIDLGVTAYGYGIGPHVKYGFLPRESPTAVSILAGVNYVMPAQVVSPRGCLAVGRLLGEDLEVYGGVEAGYGPDLGNIPEDPEGEHDWDEVENTFYNGLKAGIVYTIKPYDSSREYSSFVPYSVIFEFAVPLGLEHSMVVAGIGITY